MIHLVHKQRMEKIKTEDNKNYFVDRKVPRRIALVIDMNKPWLAKDCFKNLLHLTKFIRFLITFKFKIHHITSKSCHQIHYTISRVKFYRESIPPAYPKSSAFMENVAYSTADYLQIL